MKYAGSMTPDVLSLHGCTVDMTERVAVRTGREPVRLTDREVALLRYLAERAGQAVPVEDLERDLWGFSEATVSRAVSATVRRLRPKIEPIPGKPVNLPTVFGVGWRLMVKGTAAPRHGPSLAPDLPARPADVLVGRREFVESVAGAVGGEERWVSLVGPGGVGKSRVALEVAHLVSAPLDRVLYVEVDGDTADAGFEAVATAIGVASLATPDVVLTRLRDEGPLLLVLDHQGGVRPTPQVADWLGGCPELRVLTVGRASSGHPAERLCPVPPLVVPPRGATSDQVAESSAFELLALRARGADAEVQPDADGLIELIHALDGLPLALELAARRLRVLPPLALLETLDQPEMLAEPGAGRPERHQSLDRVIQASWAAVGAPAQSLLSSLCVFEGSFSVAEAAAAAGSEPIAVADAFDRLVSHSLLAKLPRSRFSVLRTVRAFVLRHRPPTSAHRAWHARWATVDVVPGTRREPDPREVERLAELKSAIDGADHPDVAVTASLAAARVLRRQGLVPQALALVERAPDDAAPALLAHRAAERIVCSTLLGHHAVVARLDRELGADALGFDPDQAVHTACDVASAWMRAANLGAAVQRLARVAHEAASPGTLARLARLQGAALLEAGRLEAGLSSLKRGVRLALDHGDARELAWLHMIRANSVGSVDAVAEAIEAVEAVPDDRLDPADRSLLTVSVGSLAWQAGRGHDALTVLERGVSLALMDGHTAARRAGLLTMAGVLVDQGRTKGARAAFDEACQLVTVHESAPAIRFTAGRLELSEGHLGLAEEHIRRAIELASAGSSAVSQVWNHEILALIRLAQGRLDEALHAATHALQVCRGLEASRYAVTPLAVLGRVELARGQVHRAETAAGRSCSLADRSGIPYDRSLAWLIRGEVAAAQGDPGGAARARSIVAPLLTTMDMQPGAEMTRRLRAL